MIFPKMKTDNCKPTNLLLFKIRNYMLDILLNLNAHYGGPLLRAKFLERLNRFVARIEYQGQEYSCHLAETGRLKEILVEGRDILVFKHDETKKTDFKLISVKMPDGWILLNTSIHSRIAAKAIERGVLGFVPENIRAEVSVGKSRLDFLLNNEIYLELKGSNLLVGNSCVFPDAPTSRGKRHVEELISLVEKGKRAIILIMTVRDAHYFRTNDDMDPAFAATFRNALQKGVEFKAFRARMEEINGEWLVLQDREVELFF